MTGKQIQVENVAKAGGFITMTGAVFPLSACFLYNKNFSLFWTSYKKRLTGQSIRVLPGL